MKKKLTLFAFDLAMLCLLVLSVSCLIAAIAIGSLYYWRSMEVTISVEARALRDLLVQDGNGR